MSRRPPGKRDVRFLLSEDIRQETSIKSSLLGLIPGERFAVEGSPPPNAPPGVAILLPSLAFFFVITGGQGKFEGRFKIVAPDKKTVLVDMPTDRTLDIVPGRVTVFGTAAKPFLGPTFGQYSVQLQIGEATFKFPMVIEKGSARRQKNGDR